MADQGLKAQLQFPLQLEVLLAQGIIMGIAIPLYLTRDTWYTLDAGPANIWMVLNWTGITLFLAMLLEFGFSLIDGIVRGSRRIPVFSFAFLTREIGGELADAIGNLVDVAGFKLFKQQLMVMGFLWLSWYLQSQDFVLAGRLVIGFLLVVLPASIAVNAMSGQIVAFLDPVKLIRFAWDQGACYWHCVLPLLLASACFRLALEHHFSVFLLALPVGLYCAVFMFKVLGDSLYARRDTYFSQVDFKADRKALAQLSKSREFLDRRLQAILGLVRNTKTDQACRELEHFLVRNQWQYFDTVFAVISNWPDRRPAQHVVAAYLPVALARRQYMQALELCKWQLQQDRAFTLNDNEDVLLLADQAATPGQYRVSIRLLLNRADKPGVERKILLEKAAFIAGARLNDEKRLAEIMTRMHQT